MKKVYKKGYLIVLKFADRYIVKNVKNKKCVLFRSIKTANTLIDLEIRKKLPKNPYFAEKIAKVTGDNDYRKKLLDFKESRVTFKEFESMVKRNKGIHVERCL